MVAIVTGIIGLAVAATIFLLVRKDKLHVNHALGWIAVALLCAMMGFFAPGGFDYIAAKLGITYPPALALTIGMALLVIKILAMDIERSRSDVRMQRLTQRMAILDAELEAMRKEMQRAEDAED